MYQPHEVTIYNKRTVQGKIVWRFTHLHGVFFQATKGSAVSANNFQTSDDCLLTIPFSVGEGYVEPKAYQGTGWTLQEGDVVVKGIVEDEISSKTDLTDRYSDVFSIRSVSKLDYGSPEMQHWEVTGK